MNNKRFAPGSGRISRRNLLQGGGLACLGLDFARLSRAEAAGGANVSRPGEIARLKSCILVYLHGGPCHIDTFDPNPVDAGPAIYPGQTAGFLGAAYHPFRLDQDPNASDFNLAALRLPAELPLDRLGRRAALLNLVDGGREGAAALAAGRRMATFQG